MHTGEITVRAAIHASGLWITIPVVAGPPTRRLALVFDSGSPISALNPEIRDWLAAQQLLRATDRPGTFRLAMTADGQAMPDLELRVLPRLARLRVHGLIGLNYMRHFASIHVHIPTLTITLRLPA